MCGIAGIVTSKSPVKRRLLEDMCSSLHHRGPDDQGLKFLTGKKGSSGTFVGLAHKRLSIIDLSSAGRQPLCNEDETIWLTYNGECYNYQPLFDMLDLCGHRFISKTDSEVIVHGYEEWGIETLLSRLNGMFAFALWDHDEEALILARDRLGKKPLYYTVTENKELVFASEIKALADAGFVNSDDIDIGSLIQFWCYGYSTGPQTMYKGVFRLQPGHYAVYKNGEFSEHKYWDVMLGTEEFADRHIDDLADELESLLLDAIRLRLISDVEVGVFLSGGVDSSLITALTNKVSQGSICSYTIGFEHREFDESVYAAAVASYLGINNKVLTVNENLQEHFVPIVRHFDELFGDSSAIPTYFVSKLAREYVTVVLTGDAGDELFGGYSAYAKALSIWGNRDERKRFKHRAGFVQSLADYMKLRFVPKQERLSALELIMPLSGLNQVFNSDFINDRSVSDALYNRTRWYKSIGDADLLSQLQYVNLKTYLVDDILVKVDRMSMAHGLECRSPFLDFRVVEFAAKLGFNHKISEDGKGKFILRHLLQRYMPEALIDRPKMGFTIPWSQWCRGPIGDDIIKRWQQMKNPYFRNDAVDFIFPKKRLGWPTRQWNAFCVVNYFN